jgi:hypothetical protein
MRLPNFLRFGAKKKKQDNPLIDILGAAEYARYVETQFTARLDDLVARHKFTAEDAALIKERLGNYGDIPCRARAIDDIITGRTIRGIRSFIEAEWYIPKQDGTEVTVARSFINTFQDREQYRQAYNAQNFFHYLLKHLNGSNPLALNGLDILKPKGEKHEVLLSNLFVSGQTLHSALNYGNAEKHLVAVAALLGDLCRNASAYESQVYKDMALAGEKVPKNGLFKEVDHAAEFRNKFLGHVASDTDSESMNRLLAIYNRDILDPISKHKKSIVHRDARAENIIVNGGYTLIDFESSGYDSPLAWIMPTIFMADHYGLEDKVIKAFGMPIEDLGKFKIKDNLLWAGRYIELSKVAEDSYKDELVQLARYRYTKAIQGMRQEGLDELALSFTSALGDKISALTPLEMTLFEEKYHPMAASVSIVKSNPQVDIRQIKEIYRERWQQKAARIGIPIVLAAMLLPAIIGGENKGKEDDGQPAEEKVKIALAGQSMEVPAHQFTDMENAREYVGLFRYAYKVLKTRAADGEIKTDLSRYSGTIQVVGDEHQIPYQLLNNIIEVNRNFGIPIDNATPGKLLKLNIFEPFDPVLTANDGKDYDQTENLLAGTRYLLTLKEKYGGDMGKALLEYYLPRRNDIWCIPHLRLNHQSMFDENGKVRPEYRSAAEHIREAAYSALHGMNLEFKTGDLCVKWLKKPAADFPTLDDLGLKP